MTINFDALIKFTQSAVQIKSLPGQEKRVIELFAAEMQRLNFDQVTVDETGNVVGVINGAQSGQTLLFDAHVDTVDVVPESAWQLDPFGATIIGERMYGRGTTDMKGAAAAMVYAAATADRAKLAGRVVISISVMEEVMEGFALKPVMARYQPDMVVIGEPTDLNLSHGGRGRAEFRVESFGRPSHSSTPQQGLNAVHLMVSAIQAIESLPMPTDPLIGDAVIALTDIISKPYPANSVIPSYCRVTYDRRLLPGETEDELLTTLRQRIGIKEVTVNIGAGDYQTYTGFPLQGAKFFPAWLLKPEDAFVQASLAGLRAAGLSPDLRVYQFCTNAAYSAGVANVPTIGFGPSPESMAHIVDEYIELADLRRTAEGYLGIIEAVLGG